MKSVFFKQTKPLTVKILGILFLLFVVLLVLDGKAGVTPIVIMCAIDLVLLGYSISFEIKENLEHKRHLRLLGKSLFTLNLDILSPEYVSVFSARLKKDADWGPIAAMGSQSKNGTYVIRFFKGNRHFTVWKTKSYELAMTRAGEVAKLFNVDVLQ